MMNLVEEEQRLAKELTGEGTKRVAEGSLCPEHRLMKMTNTENSRGGFWDDQLTSVVELPKATE